MLSKDLQEWYKNWRTKEASYKNEVLQDVYDRYTTLFTIYNKLYNQVPDLLKARGYAIPKKIFDSLASTKYVVDFLTAPRLLHALKKNETDIEQIELLIELEVFYIKTKNGERQRDKDIALLGMLKSKDLEKKSIAILEVVYHVRCNMVHGCIFSSILTPHSPDVHPAFS